MSGRASLQHRGSTCQKHGGPRLLVSSESYVSFMGEAGRETGASLGRILQILLGSLGFL